MRGTDFVTFDHVAEFPAGNDVGDATVFFHAANNHLGHQLAVAADQQFAVLLDALIFANVQHHKIPFRINHQNFPLEVRGQNNNLLVPSYNCSRDQIGPRSCCKTAYLLIDHFDHILRIFDGVLQLANLSAVKPVAL